MVDILGDGSKELVNSSVAVFIRPEVPVEPTGSYIRDRRDLRRRFQEKAALIGIQPPTGGTWLVADGIVTDFQGIIQAVPTFDEYGSYPQVDGRRDYEFDSYYNPWGSPKRLEYAGSYARNNGLIAFIDDRGELIVGKDTPQNIRYLETANFRRNDGIWVPFSNGDLPIDEVIVKQLEDILAGNPLVIEKEEVVIPPELEIAEQPAVIIEEEKESIPYAVVRAYGATDVGYARKVDQDYASKFMPTLPREGLDFTEPLREDLKKGSIFTIADGVGGLARGEVASKEGTQRFITEYLDLPPGDILKNLEEALVRTNQFIYETGPNGRGTMATTLAAAVVVGEDLYLVGVGDSRIYLLRDGEFNLLTQDHSWRERVRRDPSQIADFRQAFPEKDNPSGNEIYMTLGRRQRLSTAGEKVAQGPIKLRANDRLLLCTDGLWGSVDEDTIAQRLESSTDPKDAYERLRLEALDGGGSDNIGVNVVFIDGIKSV